MRKLDRIVSASDPRVADYQDLRDRELVRSKHIFIAEGTEVVRTMVLRSPYRARSILLAERFLANHTMDDVLDAAPDDVPIYIAPDEVLNAVAGFDIHRGCLAAGERGDTSDAMELLARSADVDTGGQEDLVLVLEAIANHDNLGALFRNAAAFGAGAVFLDPRSADPLYRKSIRVSMGTALTVPFARLEPWPDALQLLTRHGYALWSLTPRRGACELAELISGRVPLPRRIALLAGTEGAGLSAAALACSTQHFQIPMAPGVDSLNVATASGIALFAVAAARRACTPAPDV